MKTEILEGNKLIAEFMCWDRTEPTNSTLFEQSIKHTQYHRSWDWLMPVVEKIGNYEISRGHCWFWLTSDIGEEKEISNQEAVSTIEAAWLAVVDFIKSNNNK